jgi:hypothetical protein
MVAEKKTFNHKYQKLFCDNLKEHLLGGKLASLITLKRLALCFV